MSNYCLEPANFKKRTEMEPTSWVNKFRIGQFSYFTKPEGEGLAQKFMIINYHTAWLVWPCAIFHFTALRKVRYPKPLFYKYLQWALPAHGTASVWAISTTQLCKYRGKDDYWNWTIGGAITGLMPPLFYRQWILKNKPHWMTPVIGPLLGAILGGLIKYNDPQFFFSIPALYEEKGQFNPEQYPGKTFTLPNERFCIDWANGGRGGDMPYYWYGEKLSHRKLLCKEETGYLESELDQVPAIRKQIRERW